MSDQTPAPASSLGQPDQSSGVGQRRGFWHLGLASDFRPYLTFIAICAMPGAECAQPGPSMRGPVDVKAFCGWVSSYLMFSFARISGDSWLAVAAVKAERSEFIWSLDGRPS